MEPTAAGAREFRQRALHACSCPRCASAAATTAWSLNGAALACRRSGSPRAPCRRSARRRRRGARRQRARDRAARDRARRATARRAGMPARDVRDDALRILGARVVVGDRRSRRRARPRSRPSAGACRHRDRRRSRTRRAAGRVHARARRAAPCRARPACARSRRPRAAARAPPKTSMRPLGARHCASARAASVERHVPAEQHGEHGQHVLDVEVADQRHASARRRPSSTRCR